MRTILFLVAIALSVSGCGPSSDEIRIQAEARKFEEARKESLVRGAEYRENESAIIARINAALKAGDLKEANAILERFKNVPNHKLAELATKADILDTTNKLKNASENLPQKRSLLRHLIEVDPKNSKWKAELATVDRAIETRAAQSQQKARAERRKRGVNIGMSQDEVLQSSWGRPDKINTTTTRYGTREQWVYRSSGSGYLYFENGVLTAIQN